MLLFVWIVMQEYFKSKTVFGPNCFSVFERDPYCLTTFMLKLHEIQHPINDRTYAGCVAHTGSKANAGGREVVSNGRMSEISMNDYAAHEGMKEITTKYDHKACQTYQRCIYI